MICAGDPSGTLLRRAFGLLRSPRRSIRLRKVNETSSTMASRNRGRPSQIKDDANEERELWRQIQADARRIDALVVSFTP